MTNYELVMWLETHIRIGSETKMFCRCKNARELADEPNIHVCPICMGMPGMLPKLSEWVVDKAVRASHALRMTLHKISIFDRKSYFYPDLPQGFQITQLYHPIAEHGNTTVYLDGKKHSFRINRLHIETDAGKLVHSGNRTLCDYNRAGSPLMEIVTEPDFRTKQEVIAYLEELQKLMRWCGASEADMEKGQLRCDVNISLRPVGSTELRNRVELKNINSFSSIGRAIDAEFARQAEIYDAGGSITQETRGWDDDHGESHSMRSKEDAMDYRYFPEPDLPPLVITTEYIQARAIQSLPVDRRTLYLEDYKLQADDARILSEDRAVSDFYESVVQLSRDPKKSCSFITTVLFALFEEGGEKVDFSTLKISSEQLAQIIRMVNWNELSSTNAKEVVRLLFIGEGISVTNIVSEKWLQQVNDTTLLEKIAMEVIEWNPNQVADYKGGKTALFGFFVGQCMKKSAGQWNPKVFTEILEGKL
jgi:aspartyl-tRNA(Asn)/glutamyl-tRNA(Gln) amidotransferase subunit B